MTTCTHSGLLRIVHLSQGHGSHKTHRTITHIITVYTEHTLASNATARCNDKFILSLSIYMPYTQDTQFTMSKNENMCIFTFCAQWLPAIHATDYRNVRFDADVCFRHSSIYSAHAAYWERDVASWIMAVTSITTMYAHSATLMLICTSFSHSAQRTSHSAHSLTNSLEDEMRKEQTKKIQNTEEKKIKQNITKWEPYVVCVNVRNIHSFFFFVFSGAKFGFVGWSLLPEALALLTQLSSSTIRNLVRFATTFSTRRLHLVADRLYFWRAFQ